MEVFQAVREHLESVGSEKPVFPEESEIAAVKAELVALELQVNCSIEEKVCLCLADRLSISE